MVVGDSLPLVAIAAEGRESENMCLTVDMKVQVS